MMWADYLEQISWPPDPSGGDVGLSTVGVRRRGRHGGTVVWVPGGGFTHLDRSSVPPVQTFVERLGWRFVEAGYRSGPTYLFPAAVDDVTRLVERQTAAWGGPVVLGGHSAGACIAGLVARRTPVDGLCLFSPLGHWARLGARGRPWSVWADQLRAAWFGDLVPPAAASIARTVTCAHPPLYLAHGDSDPILHLDQACAIALAYYRAGIGHTATFDIVDTGPALGRSHHPWYGINRQSFVDWLDGRLR